jgi:hypothetical protein
MKSCEGCGLTTRLRKQTQKGNYWWQRLLIWPPRLFRRKE